MTRPKCLLYYYELVVYCPLGVFLDSLKQLNSQNYQWLKLTPAYLEGDRTTRDNRLPAGQHQGLHLGQANSWGAAEKIKCHRWRRHQLKTPFPLETGIFGYTRGTALKVPAGGLPSGHSHHSEEIWHQASHQALTILPVLLQGIIGQGHSCRR